MRKTFAEQGGLGKTNKHWNEEIAKYFDVNVFVVFKQNSFKIRNLVDSRVLIREVLLRE